MANNAKVTNIRADNERALKFVELCATGVSSEDAGELLGMNPETSRNYKWRYSKQILEKSVERWQELVPTAIEGIKALAVSSKSDAVKLKAFERILDQAGLGVTQKTETTFKSDSELMNRIADAFGGDTERIKEFLKLMAIPDNLVKLTQPELDSESVVTGKAS